MANVVTIVGCLLLSLVLWISILLAGPHLLLPATFMIVTVFVGGLCIYIAGGMVKRRAEIMKKYDV